MKKTLILTVAAGFACAMSSMATQFDLYITGATAFRQSVYEACKKLYDVTPATNLTMSAGSLVFGGNNIGNSSSSMWTMNGTVAGKIPQFGTDTLAIHADFNGSVQGLYVVENSLGIQFLDIAGALITNTATIAFSDVNSSATPYPASSTANFAEESVAIQPFVWCTSQSLSNLISNVSLEQVVFGIKQGKLPLSAWSNKASDGSTSVYLLTRTKDSGTRRNQFAEAGYAYGYSAPVYIYCETNATWRKWTTGSLVQANIGTNVNANVIGAAGAGNANVDSKWGFGYVGGGDFKRLLGNSVNTSANTSIGYLSFADAKGILTGTGQNWSQVCSYNGIWPTAAGIGVRGNTGANDFSPITNGMYTAWGEEVVVYAKNPMQIVTQPSYPNQNLSTSQLGNQTTPNTILGVLDAQTLISGGSPVPGSIENEIELSKAAGATAIRLSDMISSRSSVGGTITP
ncbi:MAG: hypothetical protein WCH99_04210 [Verrucomicrobiota bacterium]